MTVKRLRQMLADAPDDMIVYCGVATEMGAFAFMEACEAESGVSEFGADAKDYIPDQEIDWDAKQGEGFVLMPHGMSAHEDDIDDDSPSIEQMN